MNSRSLVYSLALILATGCSYLAPKRTRSAAAVDRNTASLLEASRTLSTAVVDAHDQARQLQPAINTNKAFNLADDLAKKDQLVIGLPTNRIDVAALVAENQAAVKDLQARYAKLETLLAEKQTLEAQLRASEERLITLGQQYEAERNKSIVKRVWHWGLATFGLGGIIALAVLCPAVIPLAGSLLGWLVNKLPILASYFGLVSRKAFDAVVKGVEAAKQGIDAGSDLRKRLANSLAVATDADHKTLIDARKQALNLPTFPAR